ncbi:tyrosine-protein phosphatase [Leifsonia sp. A12D58]|uniref:tyrosine-protein phosphatase n=1 Tax=Leifsonia sp. A12D58 TaxID=3397674 RepID=UPI0039DF7118
MNTEVRIPVDGTFNFREPAGFQATNGVIRSGVLYRSDALKGLTDLGRTQLVELGVRTIIDLRDDFEVKVQPDAIDDLDIDVVSLPVYEGTAAANSGPGITLPAMYESMVLEHGAMLVSALRLIAEHEDGAVLVHCTAGKDRTGIVVALALRAVGVAREVVIADYAVSEQNLKGEWLHEMLALLGRYGIEETPELRALMGGTPPDVMAGLLDLIDERYGSVGDYLISQGLTAAEIAELDNTLVASA